MIDLSTFFKNHFDSRLISDSKLLKFVQIHLGRLTQNNPGNIYDTIIAETNLVYNDYLNSLTTKASKTAIKEGKTVGKNQAVTAFKKFVSRYEGFIRAEWGVKLGEYQEFYPHGIYEYTRGTLANIEKLIDRYLSAATTHQAVLGAEFVTNVTNLRDDYMNARKSQLSSIGVVAGKKSDKKAKRTAVEKQLMKNLHTIAANNVGKTSIVRTYFDQSFMRVHKKKEKEEAEGD